MTAFMKELRGKVAIGVVGGSDTVKIKEQLGDDCKRESTAAAAPAATAPARGADLSSRACAAVGIGAYDWFFSQNGLEAYKVRPVNHCLCLLVTEPLAKRSQHHLTHAWHMAQASELIGQTVRCSQPATSVVRPCVRVVEILRLSAPVRSRSGPTLPTTS